MTVDELLSRIVNAYPGATPDALKAFKPVFYARLKHREGARLEDACNEVLATWRPKYGQPFPIPSDFEAHMPNVHAHGDKSPPIDFKGHHARKQSLLEEWRARQRPGIEKARGAAVAAACESMVADFAHMRAWEQNPADVVLTASQIQEAEDRVVSSERIGTHGVRALRAEDPTEWQRQTETIRAAVRAGRSPSKERKEQSDQPPATKASTMKRLGELAAAHRNPAASNEGAKINAAIDDAEPVPEWA